jgi:hypothetical protein
LPERMELRIHPALKDLRIQIRELTAQNQYSSEAWETLSLRTSPVAESLRGPEHYVTEAMNYEHVIHFFLHKMMCEVTDILAGLHARQGSYACLSPNFGHGRKVFQCRRLDTSSQRASTSRLCERMMGVPCDLIRIPFCQFLVDFCWVHDSLSGTRH